jgi:hypothetical protein
LRSSTDCHNVTNSGTSTILIDVFHDFPQSFQANAEIAPKISHDLFLPRSFQMLYRSVMLCCTVFIICFRQHSLCTYAVYVKVTCFSRSAVIWYFTCALNLYTLSLHWPIFMYECILCFHISATPLYLS